MSRYGNYKSTFKVDKETAEKAISNNIPNLVKRYERRIKIKQDVIEVVLWVFILTGMSIIYSIS